MKQIYRKRNKRVLKVDKEEKGGDGAEEAQLPQEEVEINQVLEKDDDAKQKKKSDDLWASFLSDVGTRPKDCTTASQSSTTQKVNGFYLVCLNRSKMVLWFKHWL